MIYPGPNAISEPEIQAVSDAMLKVRGNLKLYLAVHSCGSYVLYPYGYKSPSIPVDNQAEHQKLGEKFAEVLKNEIGERWLVGNSADVLYPANGASDDFAYSIGAEIAYTLELPCGGSQGFNYPENKIGALTRGMFKGFEVMGNHVVQKHTK